MDSQPAGSHRPTVLVIDRDREIREQLADGLRIDGYDVRAADDGHHAYEVWSRSHRAPNAVVLDLTSRLPGALSLYSRLRDAARAHGTFLLLTTDEREPGVGCGNTIVHRPFPVASVLSLLNDHVPIQTPAGEYRVRVSGWVCQLIARLTHEERAWFLRGFEALRRSPRPTHAVWAGPGQYRLNHRGTWVHYAVDDQRRTVTLVEMGHAQPLCSASR